MAGSFDRRTFLGAVALVAAWSGSIAGQSPAEKKIDPLELPLDRANVWTLHFRYKPPRIVTLDGFDKAGKPAKQTVWYLWFQVYNKSSEPQVCVPEIDLVTRDYNTSHLDQPEPYLLDQIRKIEDPESVLNIRSTIDISKRPVPVSKPDAIPRTVTGVAIWTDLPEKAPKTNRFTVYIAGLSNGLATEQSPTGDTLVRRKTLQLNFVRPTDDNRPQVSDIKPDDANGPAESWVYRVASKVRTSAAEAPTTPKKDEK